MRSLLLAALIIFPYFMGFSEEPRYNQPYMRDEWYLYGCGIFNSVDDVSKFLNKFESFLRFEEFEDVDGVIINPSAVIWEASREFGVSVELLLFTMQKEQGAVTATDPLPEWRLKKLMGYLGKSCGAVHHPSEIRTVRGQIRCAAWQFARYMRQLNYPACDGVTVGGWRVGVPHITDDHSRFEGCPWLDPIYVTPKNCAVAGLFTYTPYVGAHWGGCTEYGGNSLFDPVWRALFNFCLKSLYVANYFDNTITIIDTNTLTVVNTLSVCSGPRNIAFTPDGSKAFVTCSNSDEVAVIDARSEEVTKYIPVGDFPYDVAVTPDGRKVYVTNLDSWEIYIIDANDERVITTMSGVRDPRAIHVIGKDGSYRMLVGVHIASSAVNDPVWIFDENEDFLGSIRTGKIPIDIDSLRDVSIDTNNYVYSVNASFNPDDSNYDFFILDISRTSWSVYRRVITDMQNMCVDVDDSRVDICRGAVKVTEYPYLGTYVLYEYTAGGPRGAEKIGGKLFITNTLENTLSVYDINTRNLIKKLRVGSRPWGVRLRP